MSAAGSLAHNLLLQKEEKLASLTIVTDRSKDLGRALHPFAPRHLWRSVKASLAKCGAQ